MEGSSNKQWLEGNEFNCPSLNDYVLDLSNLDNSFDILSESLALNNSPDKFEVPKSKKRGRKEIDLPKDMKMARRAESNRRSAKESRERKRMHIENLEALVAQLRLEVEYYKSRLKKYEIIEQQRNIFGYEIYLTLERVTNEFNFKNKKAVSEQEFANIVKKNYFQLIEERCKAIELLAQTMIEITIPMPLKFFMWAAKKNINLLDASNLEQVMKNIAYIDAKPLAETFAKLFKSEKLYTESKCFFMNNDIHFNKYIKQILGAQQNLKSELRQVANYLAVYITDFISKERTDLREVLGKFLFKLKDQPEFKNYTISDTPNL